MPSKSKQQLKLIWAIRNKYKSISKAPKKWKWVFGEEWGHLAKESRIFNFSQFNESMGTLSKDDTDIIEDLCLEFSEKWNLSFDTHEGKYGYISIQRFDKFHIQFSVQTNISFAILRLREINHGAIDELQDDRKNFEEDLSKVINRIEKFGYNVLKINSGSQINGSFGGFTTYSFQISHTDEKSNQILKESFLPRKEHYLNLCWYNAEFGQILPESDIYNYVEQLHRNEEDFIEGNIGERIEQFSKYKLMEISINKINIDEYELDINFMKDYKKLFNETNNYPPIILDGDTQYSYGNKYTIIDGNHRVNALYESGLEVIKAWVGIS